MQSSRESSGFRHKLGTFFGISGGSNRPEEHWGQDHAFFFTEDVLKDLGPGSPVQVRVKILRDLLDTVTNKRLEQYAIQALWLSIKDLLDTTVPVETRHFVLGFIRSLIGGQYEELGMLRAHFLNVLNEHTVLEDFQPCFDIVRTLTDSGKNIEYLEQDMGPYLARIIPMAMGSGRSIEYLTMILNIIKHNAAYLDEDVLMTIIEGCCQTAITSSQLPVTELCLEALNAIVCYSTLPSSALLLFITTLCHTLNLSRLSKQSLDMMIRLLGTHLGMATIYTLCTALQNKTNWGNPLLLRGGVFYISMSLWGVRHVESLKVSYSSVLPAIRVASLCDHTIVIYEISLSILRLTRVYSQTLQSMEWDLVYDIIANIKEHVKKLPYKHDSHLMQAFHDLFAVISDQHTSSLIHIDPKVNPKQFFSVVGTDSSLHDLPMVMKLLMYQATSIRVGEHGWVNHYKEFMKRFYVNELETAVRIEALNQLENIISLHCVTYENELLRDIVVPLLSPIAQDLDPEICCRGVQLLVSVLNECTPSWTPQTLGIINTVLQRGIELAAKYENVNEEEYKILAVKAAILGLAPLIKSKLPRSSDVAVQVFQLLVTYLLQLYDEDFVIPATSIVRIEIINCLFSLRGNEDGFVGYHDNTGTSYSSFYVCQRPTAEDDNDLINTSHYEENSTSSNDDYSLQGTYLDYSKVALCVLSCLAKEREWEVIVKLLIGLKGVLENRTIVITAWTNFSAICSKLCSIVDSQSSWLRTLNNVPNHKSVDAISTYIYPVLASLCSYGNVLDKQSQHQLVCSLERGVVKQCGLLCVRALSIALLEMQATMTRLLPRVLYRLGQVSATSSMALPVLELLVNVISLPHLYSGFVEQQYLGVFGIVLLYADPFKHNPYVVAMAYHVISIWFLRCRIQYRPTVAQFINKQLTTLLSVYQEANSPTVTMATATMTTLGEPRKRSSSFTSPHSQSTSRQRSQTHVGMGTSLDSGNQNNLLAEMIEICVDMMARYTYSNISTQPIRSPGADFLVGNGPSKTWLLGNSLVTITTSGTGGGSNGVCSRCKVLQRSLQPNPDVLLASNESFLPTSRRMSISSEGGTETGPPLCSCWCRGWSEIKVRRPTGNVAWLMRVQNKLDILATTDSNGEYDWSLMGVNTMTGNDNSTEDDDNEWDEVLTAELSHDVSHDINDVSHDLNGESHDLDSESHDFSSKLRDGFSNSHDQSKESHDQPIESHDQPMKSRDTSNGSHDQVTKSHDQPMKSHDTSNGSPDQITKSHDQSIESHDQSIESHDTSNGSPDQITKSHDQSIESHDQSIESHDQVIESHDHESVLKEVRFQRVMAIKQSSITNRQPSSYSWSEGGKIMEQETQEDIVVPKPRDYSTRSYSFGSSSIELLPPLFSYDEGNPMSRSPSLIRDDGVLSDPEQLQLMTRVSKTGSCLNDDVIFNIPSSPEQEHNSSDSKEHLEPDEEDDAIVQSIENNENDDILSDKHLETEKLSNDTSNNQNPLTDIPIIPVIPVITYNSPQSAQRVPSPRKPPSSSPGSRRKRVLFSNPPPSSKSLREELPVDVYNNPSFIFLQLYHTSGLGVQSQDPPILLPVTESVERAIKVLDHIPPYNTHKIGVVYVGEDQSNEQDILSNMYGPSRYQQFIKGLGQLIQLKECPPNLVYLGGLDTSGTDGTLACFWEDDITQVIFHVATLMPTHPANPACSNKKLHIGNDFVTIVYNDSGKKYKFGTIKGQFNYVEVVIEPLGCGINQVYLSVRDTLVDMLDCMPFLVSDKWLPLLARQRAILANLASLVLLSESTPDNYASNWLGRLRQIKRIKERTLEQNTDKKTATGHTPQIEDFILYC